MLSRDLGQLLLDLFLLNLLNMRTSRVSSYKNNNWLTSLKDVLKHVLIEK